MGALEVQDTVMDITEGTDIMAMDTMVIITVAITLSMVERFNAPTIYPDEPYLSNEINMFIQS